MLDFMHSKCLSKHHWQETKESHPWSSGERSTQMRKIIGIVAILTYLTVYIIIAMTIGTYLISSPKWLQLIYYIIAGVIWVLPLKPVMKWANTEPQSDQDDYV